MLTLYMYYVCTSYKERFAWGPETCDCMNIKCTFCQVFVLVGVCIHLQLLSCLPFFAAYRDTTLRLANVSNEVERQCKACTCFQNLHLHHNVWSLLPASLLHTGTSSGCKPLHHFMSVGVLLSVTAQKLHIAFHISICLQKLRLHNNNYVVITAHSSSCIASTSSGLFFSKMFPFPIQYPSVVCWYVKFPFPIFQDYWLSGC